jgi:hypothetical protein
MPQVLNIYLANVQMCFQFENKILNPIVSLFQMRAHPGETGFAIAGKQGFISVCCLNQRCIPGVYGVKQNPREIEIKKGQITGGGKNNLGRAMVKARI